jgi:hypothetical protein
MGTVQLGQDNSLPCIARVAGQMDDPEAGRQGRHGRHHGSTNRQFVSWTAGQLPPVCRFTAA